MADQELTEIVKLLIEDEAKLLEFLEQLNPLDRQFVEDFIVDLDAHTELDPLTKFKYNNDKQIEFLSFDKPFQFFIGGNKGGKTATITYKGDKIALGLDPTFKRKPTERAPLINWLCGENRDVLEQTPKDELLKWLRPDQYKIIKKGTYIDRIRIFPDITNKKIYSDFIFKPYSGGVDIFESANVNGVILCDEEIPEAIFRALIPRMVAYGAKLFNALTPTHGITYTADILHGKGNYTGLKGEDLVQWVEVATTDNLANIDKDAYRAMVATYALHDTNGKIVLDSNGEAVLTPEGEIRLLGKFASITGRVYPTFKRELQGKAWHIFDSNELPDLADCRIFACTDYGRRDDFVFILIAIDKNDTHWCLEEVYRKNMEVLDQAMAIREVCDNWNVKPLMVVADSQIKHRKSSGGTILDEYLTCQFPPGHSKQGQTVLGYDFSSWRAEVVDKYTPETARAEIGRNLEPNSITKEPSLRFSRNLCPKSIDCIEALQWKKGGRQEGTAGENDHAEAALRYYFRVGIKYEHWETAEEMKEKQNRNPRYNKKGSYSAKF
jgi:hypothetical protein